MGMDERYTTKNNLMWRVKHRLGSDDFEAVLESQDATLETERITDKSLNALHEKCEKASKETVKFKPIDVLYLNGDKMTDGRVTSLKKTYGTNIQARFTWNEADKCGSGVRRDEKSVEQYVPDTPENRQKIQEIIDLKKRAEELENALPTIADLPQVKELVEKLKKL